MIEVLVALVVVSAGLTAALRVFGMSLNALGGARDSLTYDRLIQEHWAELDAETVLYPRQAPVSGQGRFEAPDHDFYWTRTVIPVPHDPTEGQAEFRGQLYDVELVIHQIDAMGAGAAARRVLLAGPFEPPEP